MVRLGVAQTTYKGRRLIVRRTRLIGDQAELFANWRHFGFVTDLKGCAVEIDQFHRNRARVELSIKDLKEGAGLEHIPSGKFDANSAWLSHAILAHNLMRQVSYLGEITPNVAILVPWTTVSRNLGPLVCVTLDHCFALPWTTVSSNSGPLVRVTLDHLLL